MKFKYFLSTASALLIGSMGIASADVTLTIESWRNDDLSIWQEKIIPAFEAENSVFEFKIPANVAEAVALVVRIDDVVSIE